MGNDKKLNVDSESIKSASKALSHAQSDIKKAMNAISSMGIRSISGSGMAPAGIMANIKDSVTAVLSRESDLLGDLSYNLNHNANVLLQADTTSNEITTPLNDGRSSGNHGGSYSPTVGSTVLGEAVSIGITDAVEEDGLQADETVDIYRPILEQIGAPISILPVIEPIGVSTEVSPIQDVTEVALEQLQKYLKKGDLTAATTAYNLLVALGNKKKADAMLKKYGYKSVKKDGKYEIVKIDDSNSNNNQNNNSDPSTNPSNQDNNQSTNTEVVADETTTPTSDTTNNDNNQNVVNTSNSNNNNGNYSNANNNNQTVVENTSTEVNNDTDTGTPVETDTVTSSTTTGVEDSVKESHKESSKTNVVSITDDSKTTAPKKSSGVGTAVSVGLGTIATGAAAVAGVRYVKNRHDNQEEYDENYDDENNNLDENEEYVDSAQYDDGSSYMDDDYLGPIDENNNLSEDSYVDPEDLEENENFSDDVVLEDLNSNY